MTPSAGESDVGAVEADVAVGTNGKLVFRSAAGGVGERELSAVEVGGVGVG